jgi:NTP pyrophosphatase (non-canonical NTP hydrolase)
MTNCKHGNGPDCLQCAYDRDVASGYPYPWRLWEVSRYGAGFQGYCSSKENPLSGTLNNTYRRRPDADQMIEDWKWEQDSPPALVVERYADNGSHSHYEVINKIDGSLLVERVELPENDKCATCRPALPEPMREGPKPCFFDRVLSHFGKDSQLDMMAEECAELIAAINRFRRGRCGKESVIEEIADVMVMLQQMYILFGRKATTEAYIIKCERLKKAVGRAEARKD